LMTVSVVRTFATGTTTVDLPNENMWSDCARHVPIGDA
jgi:hypothetical protein